MNGCVNSIAIDGPAASGKSTIAQLLAERIGYLFFDTGVMYRAVTYAALERELDLDDHAAVTRLTHALDLDIRPPTADDERQADVFIDGIDHTWDIRLPRVDAHVSRVAAIPGVRDSLGEQQRKIGLRGGVVMVGRDIGTVVLPEACFKVYLDASVEERAHRRFQENEERGEQGSYEQVLADMRKRDRIDSSRDIAPLRPAEDAVILNSDGQTIDAVVEQIVAIFEAKSNGESH